MILVQQADFCVAEHYAALSNAASDGAVVTFVGKVRDMHLGDNVTGLILEHYPAMTEKALQQIVAEAKSRWPLSKVHVIHRVGALQLGEQIVFVGVASAHRDAAFAGCQFIMDNLKTKAPFWKKELLEQGARWVDAKQSDSHAAERWHETLPK